MCICTGDPMQQIINENGLAIIMPVMLASSTGMVAFSVILLCLFGCKHRHRKYVRLDLQLY